MLYLNKLDTGKINLEQEVSYIEYTRQQNRKIVDIKTAKNLVKKYYLDSLKIIPTYRHYKCFIKMLFSSLETFSQSIYFNIQILLEDHKVNSSLQLDKVREAFFKICIRNSLEYLEETINTNNFEDNSGRVDFRKKL